MYKAFVRLFRMLVLAMIISKSSEYRKSFKSNVYMCVVSSLAMAELATSVSVTFV